MAHSKNYLRELFSNCIDAFAYNALQQRLNRSTLLYYQDF